MKSQKITEYLFCWSRKATSLNTFKHPPDIYKVTFLLYILSFCILKAWLIEAVCRKAWLYKNKGKLSNNGIWDRLKEMRIWLKGFPCMIPRRNQKKLKDTATNLRKLGTDQQHSSFIGISFASLPIVEQ